MTLPTLETVEEDLNNIVSSFSRPEWKENKDKLSRIRALTIEHQKDATSRRVPKPVKEHATSLQELLELPELPDDGQASSEPAGPILDTIENEKDVHELCLKEGLQPKAIVVAKAVYRSLARPESLYEDIWHSSSDLYKAGGTIACRLLQTESAILNQGDVHGAKYRVNALLFAIHFRAQCEASGLKGKQGTVIIQRMMKESGKNSDQIKSLLKRGRWYALWVSELCLGAILVLGESLAWNNPMHDIGDLITVCKALPGFCERSRCLSDLAGKAVVQAIIKSGQTVPVAGQRYISYHGTSPMSSNDRIGSTIPGILDRQTWTLPPLQEPTVQCIDARPTPARFPIGLTRRQESTTQTLPVTGLRYIDYSGTATMSSNDQVRSAIADRQTLNSLPSIQEINEQPAAGVPPPGSFQMHDPAALGQRFENVPNLEPQWQLNGGLIRQQETGAQTVSFTPSPNASNSTHAALTGSHEVPLHRKAASHPDTLAQTCFTTIQGYDNVSAGDSAWDGTSYNTQSEGLNPEFWDTNFPLYN